MTSPTENTDDYETGAYYFFDYENWVTAQKEQFKFEYQFLEDDVPPAVPPRQTQSKPAQK